jgi:hypothetical protein
VYNSRETTRPLIATYNERERERERERAEREREREREREKEQRERERFGGPKKQPFPTAENNTREEFSLALQRVRLLPQPAASQPATSYLKRCHR